MKKSSNEKLKKFRNKALDQRSRGQGAEALTPTVPILKYGTNTNLAVFKQKLTVAAMMLFGDLARLVETDEYYEPPKIKIEDYDLDNDPHGLNLEELKDARKTRQRKIDQMRDNRSAFYAFMYDRLSNESVDAIKQLEEYEEINSSKDPLLLWLAIKQTHKTATNSNVGTIMRAETRKKYQDVRQGPFESIVAYKERFDFLLEAYNDMENPKMEEEDIAMDFFRGLDDTRYEEFKTSFMNDLMMGTQKPPKHVNEIYTKASKYITPKRGAKPNGGVAFVSRKDTSTKQQRRTGDADDKTKSNGTDESKGSVRKHRGPIVCWGCGKTGHKLNQCQENVEPEEKQCSVTMQNAFTSGGERFEWYEVLLDNQADVSVVHPWLLTDVRPADRKCKVAGLSGHAVELPNVGELPQFFTCKTADNLRVSVLCQADVEDLYPIVYEPGVSYTVCLPNRELVFYRRNKMYIADMRDWVTQGRVNITTTRMKEQEYTKSEVVRARRALELVRNAGFDSEQGAMNLVSDGNVTDVPLTAQDVRRAFDIYGKPYEAVRGKTTKRKSGRQYVDVGIKADQPKPQRLYTDIFSVRKQPFLITLSEPLGLTLVSPVASEKTDDLGLAFQEQVSLLRSHGFAPTVAYLDPQPGFQPLRGQITGVEVDVCGAGDHMDKVDLKIRRLKETIRSVQAGLPWSLPDNMVRDLVKYSNSRLNIRRPSTGTSIVAPRVAFTGRKPNYRKELELAFGDYVECYNPKVRSNDAEQSRTEPCIALYPTGNANGSWLFMNVKTHKRVRRTHWVKMKTTQLIIDAINQMAKMGDTTRKSQIPNPLLQSIEAEEQQKGEDMKESTPEDVKQTPVAETIVEDVSTTVVDVEHSGDPLGDDGDNEGEVPELVDEELDDDVPTIKSGSSITSSDETGVENDRSPDAKSKPVEYRAFHTSAMKGLREYGPPAYNAIISELKQLLHDKKAMRPVHRKDLSATQLKRAIRSLMFLKTKYDGLGRFEKIKARLVANGAQQDRKVYVDTSSPTAAMQSIMMCLAIAAKEGRHIGTMDIGGAYLNAEMSGEEVIMELEPMLTTILKKVAPEVSPYVDETGKLLVRLDKALYGCIQSAKLWYNTLTGYLKSLGFEHNAVDPCVMNKVAGGRKCTVVIFVDDILVMSSHKGDYLELLKKLKEKFGDVKHDDGKDLSYLGMHIRAEGDKVTVSMRSYIENFLREHGVTGTATSPATATLFKNTMDKPTSKSDRRKFHKMVAQLLYLAKRVRPDILLAVAYLSTRVKNPTHADMEKLGRVTRYLNATKGQDLLLCIGKNLTVTGYVDAAFGTHDDGKGHSGLVVKVGDATVLCKSSKQRIVTRDSTESELVGLSDMLMMIVQCAEFIKEQGYSIDAPRVLQDNTSTLSLVTKGGGKYRTKYLRVRREFIKERADEGSIQLEYLPTKMMLADALTKPLQGTLYKFMTCGIVGNNTHATGVRRAK